MNTPFISFNNACFWILLLDKFFFSAYFNIWIIYMLRILARLGMVLKSRKSDPPCMLPSIIILLDHLSNIWVTTFWQSGQGCQKCIYIFKVTFSVRAEIQNGRTCCFLDTFNFSSATKGHFSNGNILLTSLATWSKLSLRFLIDGLVTELLREMCKGGLFFIEFSTIPSKYR